MSFFLMLMQLIPSIIKIVREIEAAIPAKGKGAEKLDLVLNTVNAAAEGATDVAKAVGSRDLNGAVTKIVNATVSTMNATGAFKSEVPVAP